MLMVSYHCSLLIMNTTKADLNKQYCCKWKCFEIPFCQVDGIACMKCESFSYCCCKCKTFMEEKALWRQPNIPKCIGSCEPLMGNDNPEKYCDVCVSALYLISDAKWEHKASAGDRLRRSNIIPQYVIHRLYL